METETQPIVEVGNRNCHSRRNFRSRNPVVVPTVPVPIAGRPREVVAGVAAAVDSTQQPLLPRPLDPWRLEAERHEAGNQLAVERPSVAEEPRVRAC